ncbi:MAG: amidohydrolase family protein, partial [Planctomycetes bacterium]|nr:amidohydrolase family protein [Planctomycetota bacterium]
MIDATGTRLRPGALLVERGRGMPRLLAVGTPAEVASHPAANAARLVQRPDSVLIPGLVNAHTHLDLTHLGPMDHDPDAGFVTWVDRIRAGRRTDSVEIAASVRLGIERSLAGGTVAVGDIAGAVDRAMTTVPYETLAASALLGVSFAEFFGIGTGESGSLERVERFVEAHCRVGSAAPPPSDAAPRGGGVRLGLQPHAPYTVSPHLYQRVVRLAGEAGLPVSTHLAETP